MDNRTSDFTENDPVSAVICQFRRTRRNRLIVVSAGSASGLLLSFASDTLGGAGTIFSMALILILCYAYYRIFKSEQREEQNPESFPSVANDLRLLRESRKKKQLTELAGYHVMPDGWLIKSTLLVFDFFRTSEICWVYPTRTKHYVNFLPIYTEHGLAARLKSGRILKANYREEKVREKVVFLHQIAPWAVFGYSKEHERVWRDLRETFVAAVETRCRAMGGLTFGDTYPS